MSKQEKFKDVLTRAWRTFWQASMSYLIVNIHVIADAITTDLEVGGFETLKSVGLTVGVGAIAAGLSALYNGVIRPLIIKPTEVVLNADEIASLEGEYAEEVGPELLDGENATDLESDYEATETAGE